jgi:glutamate 5-kinase
MVDAWGTGGMTTKLAAARIATASGVTVHLADGRDPARLAGLLEGDRGGTVFHPHPRTPRQPSQLVGPCLGSRGGTLPGPRRLSGPLASRCLPIAGGCDGGEG